LPAYTHNGILFSRIFQGTTDSAVFEDFIEQFLHHCGRWPEPYSVLIMDNASFHRGERVQQMCDAAGVKLLYLPPYSPVADHGGKMGIAFEEGLMSLESVV
jgi:transposase